MVFDMETLGVGRKFRGHRGQVGGVSWSGDSRWLVSTAQDWGVWVWDLSKREGEGGWCREVSIGKMGYLAELSLADPYVPFLLSIFSLSGKVGGTELTLYGTET